MFDINAFLDAGPPVNQFTLPAIEHDGKTIMDSMACAVYLEDNFPGTPSLFPYPDSVAFARCVQTLLMMSIRTPIFPFLLPRITAMLDDRGSEYFRRTREANFKLTISEDIFQDKDRWDTAWKEASAGLKVVDAMLKDNKEGPFFAGKQRTYADLILLAFLKWWKRCGDDIYAKVTELAPEFQKVWDASTDILPQ